MDYGRTYAFSNFFQSVTSKHYLKKIKRNRRSVTLGSAIKFWLNIGCFTLQYMENIKVALRFLRSILYNDFNGSVLFYFIFFTSTLGSRSSNGVHQIVFDVSASFKILCDANQKFLDMPKVVINVRSAL